MPNDSKAALVFGTLASIGGFDLNAEIGRSIKRANRGKPNSERPAPQQIVSYASDTRQQRRARAREQAKRIRSLKGKNHA